jgi:hypothetical protein
LRQGRQNGFGGDHRIEADVEQKMRVEAGQYRVPSLNSSDQEKNAAGLPRFLFSEQSGLEWNG